MNVGSSHRRAACASENLVRTATANRILVRCCPAAGIAADRALFYVTGGAAFGKTEYNMFAVDGGGNSVTVNGDTTRSGYAVGGGVEWAFFGGWTAKAEYQYLNFGNIGPITAAAVNPAGVPAGTTATLSSFRNDYHTIRVGLNYMFNAGPVVARY
jgi:outer membrane immunogenic protein